jgi:magnesium chelatase subunit I
MVAVCNRHFNVEDLEDVVTKFKAGYQTEVSDTLPSQKYIDVMNNVEGLNKAVAKLDTGENPALMASAIEFILEGLHLNKRLNKDRVSGRVQYRG